MKKISTYATSKYQKLVIKILFGFTTIFCFQASVKAQVLLSQNFNASTVVNDYVGTGTNQFDYIGVSAPSGSNSVYASGNRMNVQRYSGSGVIAKSTNLSATSPIFLRISFKMNVPFNTIPTTNPATQAIFYIGNNIVAGTTTTGEVRFASFGVGFGSNGTYYLRNLNTFANSDSLVGEKEIHWFINKSGTSQNYANTAGGTTTIANNTCDLWIGNQLVFSAIPPVTATATLDNFKLLFNGAAGGAIAIDDISITTGANALPIVLSNFKANTFGSTNQLTWATVSETNSKGFYIERKLQNGNWETLGFVNAKNAASTYSFNDNIPMPISYYRLRQVDFDGKETYSNTVTVTQKTKDIISIFPNPTKDKVVINLSQLSNSGASGNVVLFDFTGRKVLTKTITNSITELSLSDLPNGIYTISIQTGDTVITEKIIKQ